VFVDLSAAVPAAAASASAASPVAAPKSWPADLGCTPIANRTRLRKAQVAAPKASELSGCGI
jgi:hypothetical protein